MQLQIIDNENRRDIRKFVNFPFSLYRENAYWVPPLQGAMESVMNRKTHPFYRHSTADFFIVEEGKETLGRIAVLMNENYCAAHNTKTAFFYYFESLDDNEAAGLLFNAAFEWAKSHGADQMLGPKGFLRSDGQGLLVEGFDVMPAMGIAYNPPYYSSLIEKQGFEKETDHLSGYVDHLLTPRLHQAAERVIARGQFKVKKFHSKKELLTLIPQVEIINRQAFEHNPGFYPSTEEEFALLSRNIIAIADPRMIKLIMHGDQVAGFIISYPNINQAIKKINGKIFPFGWVHLLSARRNSKIADLNGIGLLPQFQGLGGNVLLYAEVENTLAGAGMKRGEIVQVDERNFRSKSDMETMGVIWNKRHRTYHKQL